MMMVSFTAGSAEYARLKPSRYVRGYLPRTPTTVLVVRNKMARSRRNDAFLIVEDGTFAEQADGQRDRQQQRRQDEEERRREREVDQSLQPRHVQRGSSHQAPQQPELGNVVAGNP